MTITRSTFFTLAPVAAAALLFVSCHGDGGDDDGGGGDNEGPLLVSASFFGTTGGDTTPDPGERVQLSFDRPVAPAAGQPFTSGALALTGSATLGQGTLTLTARNAFTLEVTLGAGVSFTPGVTTLTVTGGQQAIVGEDNRPARPGPAATIHTGTPEISLITIDSIPAPLNGSGAAGGDLLVPTQGFPLDLAWNDRDGGSVVPDTLVVGATVAVTTSAGRREAGNDLVPYFTTSGAGAGGIRLTAGGNITFPEGSFTLWAAVRDDQGKLSPRAAIDLVGADPDDDLTPFESPQVWYIELGRDRQDIAISGGATITVNVTQGADGTADFLEELTALGLRSGAPLFADLGDGTHPNDFLLARVKAAILDNLEGLADGTPISFTFTDPGGFPAALQVPIDQATHSRIALGGASELRALGLAFYDERNRFQVDDTAWPGSTPSYTVALGVFLTELIDFSVNAASSTTFRLTFDPLMPGRGTPAGEGANDLSAMRWLAGLAASTPFTDRADKIEKGWLRLGRFCAVALAHEMGHSMGLVENGAPPVGLFGNLPASFPGSDDGHIDLGAAGIYTFPAQNVMAPGISFLGALQAATGYNALNAAWLKGRVLYLGTTTGKVPGW